MELEEIKFIVELMSKHNLSEFKVRAENLHLCLKRDQYGTGKNTVMQQPIGIPQQMTMMAAPTQASVASATSKDEAPAGEKNTINAPIVGTFYRSPGPDAEVFVKVGDKVGPETVVCIIEAMKVMNEIKAEKVGVVKEILVKNAQSVEYGCPLFLLE
jgi:acetyl-CoA carboxylase biotin carboxyl carrier protein